MNKRRINMVYSLFIRLPRKPFLLIDFLLSMLL